MKEAGKQLAKRSFKIQTKRKKKTISPHKLGFCIQCFPKDSLFYRKKNAYYLPKACGVIKKRARSPAISKIEFCFNVMRSKEQYEEKEKLFQNCRCSESSKYHSFNGYTYS